MDAWPEISEGPKIQGFAGYKAGMTHAFIVDFRKSSTTAGQEIKDPGHGAGSPAHEGGGDPDSTRTPATA